ncbi:MAG: hypothetical protein ACRD8Z_06760 [Nitrososphaeraceae archaeon]
MATTRAPDTLIPFYEYLANLASLLPTFIPAELKFGPSSFVPYTYSLAIHLIEASIRYAINPY